LSRNVSSTLK